LEYFVILLHFKAFLTKARLKTFIGMITNSLVGFTTIRVHILRETI